MSETASPDDATNREHRVEYLAKKLKIPRPEADRLLGNMQDSAEGADE